MREMLTLLISEADVIDRLEYGHTRNIENALRASFDARDLYRDLTDAFTQFIMDGCKAGTFYVDNPRARAAFLTHGMLGHRAYCESEISKVADFRAIIREMFGL